MGALKTVRMFRMIWRINAALILAVGVLSLVVLSGVLYFFVKDATRTRQVDNVANAVAGEVEKRRSQLGRFEQVAGHEVLRAPLEVEETYRFGSGPKEAGSLRNYLHFDPVAKQSRWLKKDFESLIIDTRSLPESEHEQPRKRIQVSVYTIVAKDTNHDQRLTRDDQKQIAISLPDGTGFRVVVPEADRLNEATLVRGNTLLILYSRGQKLMGIELPLADPDAQPKSFEVEVGKALGAPG